MGSAQGKAGGQQGRQAAGRPGNKPSAWLRALCRQVYVPPHPLVKHWLAILRNAATPNPMFRAACAELGRVLIYEAVREFLPTVQAEVMTPLGPTEVEFVDPTKPVKVRSQT